MPDELKEKSKEDLPPPKPGGATRKVILSPATRGSLMFLAGLGLTIREALLSGPERPSLYILYAGMMGFPLVQNAFGKGGE